MPADAQLSAALKQARSKKMFFAFIPKGASDGQLMVSKTKIPPKQISDAKKAIGGGNPVTGKCFGGDSGALVFQVVKAAPATLAVAVKKVAKRETGLTIDPDFQLAGDADAEEVDTGATAQAAAPAATPAAPPAAPAVEAAAPNAASAAPPAAAGQGNVLGIQKALQKLGFDPGKLDGITGPHTQAAIKKFQQAQGLAVDGIAGPKTQAALAAALKGAAAAPAGANATPTADVDAPSAPKADSAPKDAGEMPIDFSPWMAARQKAVNDLKALATKVAVTKHGAAAAVLKEINSIITRLPAKPAPHELGKLEDWVCKDEAITAAEEVPADFHHLNIREPLLKALAVMRK